MSCITSIWVIIIGLICIASGLASGPASSGTGDVKIVFINNPTSPQIYGLDQASEIVKNPKFDATRPSVLYIHGYIESLASSTAQLIVNAYIKEGSYNIFVLDWSILAGGSYPDAVSNSNQLGPKIAEILISLFTHGLKSESIHLVGHSLGAHLCGQIGRLLNHPTSIMVNDDATKTTFEEDFSAIDISDGEDNTSKCKVKNEIVAAGSVPDFKKF